MPPATTLPAAVPACEGTAVCAVAAGHDAAVPAGQNAAPRSPAVCGTSWRKHRKTPPRDGDAALAEPQAMGSLWRGADGVIEEGPVPPEGIVMTACSPAPCNVCTPTSPGIRPAGPCRTGPAATSPATPSIKKVRSRKRGDIVVGTTSTHMLTCTPAAGAPADDTGEPPRPPARRATSSPPRRPPRPPLPADGPGHRAGTPPPGLPSYNIIPPRPG